MLETHILRSQIDKGSNILLLLGDVHAAACGLQSKDCGPSMHPGDFLDSLKPPVGPVVLFLRNS